LLLGICVVEGATATVVEAERTIGTGPYIVVESTQVRVNVVPRFNAPVLTLLSGLTVPLNVPPVQKQESRDPAVVHVRVDEPPLATEDGEAVSVIAGAVPETVTVAVSASGVTPSVQVMVKSVLAVRGPVW